MVIVIVIAMVIAMVIVTVIAMVIVTVLATNMTSDEVNTQSLMLDFFLPLHVQATM